jgi:hypothetical protein
MLLPLAALLAVVAVHAAETKPAASAAKPAAATTLKGEIVDTGCYIAHEAEGEKHVGCANKCIAGGMPMGLLTADGKLYLITLDHEMADPVRRRRRWPARWSRRPESWPSAAACARIDLTGIKLRWPSNQPGRQLPHPACCADC